MTAREHTPESGTADPAGARGVAAARSNPPGPGHPPVWSAAADAAQRAAYLTELTTLLWPEPARAAVGRGSGLGPATYEYLVLPGARQPRLVLPRRPRRAAAAAVLGFNSDRSRRARIRSRALRAALLSGLGPLALRDRVRVHGNGADTIETHLSAVLDRDIVIGFGVTPARANRKPVLQLLTPAGETVGFAKLGTDELTRALVRSEAGALRTLSRFPRAVTAVPRVLYEGTWREIAVLVQEPLPVWRPRGDASWPRVTAAMNEIARLAGVRVERAAASPYWTGIADTIARLDRASADAAALARLFDRLTAYGDTELAFGSWHGDWTRWNMAALPDTVLVWDWERFATGVPVGFDAIHYRLQDAIAGRGEPPRRALRACLATVDELLTPFGVGAGGLVAALYCVEIGARYLRDGQAEAGAPLGRLDHWLLPELGDHLARL